MDPTNSELYRLAVQDLPYLIAGYAILWIALVGYVTIVLRRIMQLEKQTQIIEESLERRSS
jgi:CcmD family protein